MLVSGASAIAESLASQQKQQLAALEKRNVAAQRERDRITEASEHQARANAIRAQEADNATRARLLALAFENEKLARDVRLSRLVAERTNSIMGANHAILNETGRGLRSFRDIEARIVWCAVADGDPEVKAALDQHEHILTNLNQIAKQPEHGLRLAGAAKMEITPRSPYYPPLFALDRTTVNLTFMKTAWLIDSTFTMVIPAVPSVIVQPPEVNFVTDGILEKDSDNSDILSTVDLDGTIVLLSLRPGMSEYNTLNSGGIDPTDEQVERMSRIGIKSAYFRIGGRSFHINGENWKRVTDGALESRLNIHSTSGRSLCSLSKPSA